MYIHRPLNYIPDGPHEKDFKFDKSVFNKLIRHKRSKYLRLLPKHIDHTPNMTPVKDQGTLGSCVAFSLAALKEWQEYQEFLNRSNKYPQFFSNNPFHDLSEQWIYYKTKEVDGIRGEGTTIRAALNTLKTYGVPVETSWVYNDKYKGLPNKNSIAIGNATKIGTYFRIKTINEMKLSLLYSPVPIGVMIYDTFYSVNSSGVIKEPNKKSKNYGGHAICAVGYDDRRRQIKFKNSWSTGWGKRGYGYISYKYFKKYCLAAWAVSDVCVDVDYLNTIKDLL